MLERLAVLSARRVAAVEVAARGADERTARSGSLLKANFRSSRALATQIPNRLAERLRVGDLPSGRLAYVAARIHDVHLVGHANLLEVHAAKLPLQVGAVD